LCFVRNFVINFVGLNLSWVKITESFSPTDKVILQNVFSIVTR